MFADIASVYDLLKSHRDYVAEATAISALIREEMPHAVSVLEVACGTGSLLASLKEYNRAGLDNSGEMLALARLKLGDEASLHFGDMQDFLLPKSDFDVLLCVDGALGYVHEVDLDRTIATFAQHMAPGALLIVEPWYTPQDWQPGRIHVVQHRDTCATVVRVGYGYSDGTIEFHTVIGTAAGIRTVDERYEFTLHTHAAIFSRLRGAGFADVRTETTVPFKRGLIMARRRLRGVQLACPPDLVGEQVHCG